MMKKKMTVLTGLILAVVMTAYSVSGTYAKYTSSFTGETDTARVAKWAFTVGDAEGAVAEQNFTFDLFAALKEEDAWTNETDVVAKNNDFVIAPGTGGYVEIDLANDSEVNATYTVAFELDNAYNVPVEFRISRGGQVLANWDTDLEYFNTFLEEVAIENNGGEDYLTIEWRWPFNDSAISGKDDEIDTKFGLDGIDTIKVYATVVAEQVD